MIGELQYAGHPCEIIAWAKGDERLAMAMPSQINDLVIKRDAAIVSLLKSLEHLSRTQQFHILTSLLSIEQLEKMAKFQDRS